MICILSLTLKDFHFLELKHGPLTELIIDNTIYSRLKGLIGEEGIPGIAEGPLNLNVCKIGSV
jgi:hypothetical protein